jgi:hypothetical protein
MLLLSQSHQLGEWFKSFFNTFKYLFLKALRGAQSKEAQNKERRGLIFFRKIRKCKTRTHDVRRNTTGHFAISALMA